MSLANYSGVMVNAIAIFAGGILGVLLGSRFAPNLRKITMQALGLATIIIGLKMAMQGGNMLLLILSLVLGGLAGELLGIQRQLDSWENMMGGKLKDGGRLGKGLIFATLIYGIGPMAIMGSLESGLHSTHAVLLTKALLDGTSAIPFAAAMGWGVSLAAIPILIYQGGIVLFALKVSPFLTPEVTGEITAVGGLLILCIGLNVLEITRIPVASLLPALPIVVCLLFIF